MSKPLYYRTEGSVIEVDEEKQTVRIETLDGKIKIVDTSSFDRKLKIGDELMIEKDSKLIGRDRVVCGSNTYLSIPHSGFTGRIQIGYAEKGNTENGN